jgi:hypothetical protein
LDLTQNKAAVVSVGTSNWYAAGVSRLESSLNYHGFFGTVHTWKDVLPPGAEPHVTNPYAYKLVAMKEAVMAGATHVLWLDASLWAIKGLMPVFDWIDEFGIYGFHTGYSIGQTATDKLLLWSGLGRDDAMNIPEIATGAVGINFKNPDASKAFKIWDQMSKEGLFKNSRVKDPADSEDPRHLFSRQDQSAFGVALWMAGVKVKQNELVMYYPSGVSDTVLYVQGL